KEMGLPVRKLIVCTNDNHVLYDFFKTGVYDISDRKFIVTHSPSMDILISSNLERLLYFLFKDEEKIKQWMTSLQNTKSFELSQDELQILKSIFDTQMCSNQKTYENIKDVFLKKDILIDPHTATAIPETSSDTLQVIVSTASPYKFPKLYQDLFELIDGDDFHVLNEIELRTKEPYPEKIRELISLPVRFDKQVSLDKIEETLHSFIMKEQNDEI